MFTLVCFCQLFAELCSEIHQITAATAVLLLVQAAALPFCILGRPERGHATSGQTAV